MIREIREADRQDWLRMRDALWPGSHADHDAETRAHFESTSDKSVVFVADTDGRLVGFLELDFRTYAEGCESSPVPFIEGWYVDPECRGKGVGRALVAAAEDHVRGRGFNEIASDAEISNTGSHAAHRALGFVEVERIVCFHKSLKGTA
jgi:aminoglycoside 6'-N-acetyltransferase I